MIRHCEQFNINTQIDAHECDLLLLLQCKQNENECEGNGHETLNTLNISVINQNKLFEKENQTKRKRKQFNRVRNNDEKKRLNACGFKTIINYRN